MRSTGYAVSFISRWWAVIGAFRSSLFLARSCSLSGPLLYRFPVVFLDRGHPRFGNFNSAIPVDVIRVKSYVNSFLDPSGVPVRVSINKLYLVPQRVMAGLVGVLRETAEVWVRASRISLSWSLILSCIDLPVSPM